MKRSDGNLNHARERRCVILDQVPQMFRIISGFQFINFLFNQDRNNRTPPQRNNAEQNDSHRDERNRQKECHKNTALEKEILNVFEESQVMHKLVSEIKTHSEFHSVLS